MRLFWILFLFLNILKAECVDVGITYVENAVADGAGEFILIFQN